MKMKKTLAAVCAAALVVSMAATASLAVDYSQHMVIGSGPANNNTAAPTITTNAAPATGLTYAAVKAAATAVETVEIDTDKCKLSTAAMSAIAKVKKTVSFVNGEGVTLTIDPKTIKKLGTIDLGMEISKKSSELAIDLKADGELGLTLKITLPKDIIPEGVDLDAAHVYADGEDLGAATLDADGNVVLEITSGADIVIK